MRGSRSPLGTLLFAMSLVSFLCLEARAKIKDPSQYPLRVTILKTQPQSGTSGWGYANVLDGASLEGATFKYEGCPYIPRPTEKGSIGRWKKGKERRVILLVVDGGGKDQFECELSTQMKGVVYGFSPIREITTYPMKR